MINQAAATRFFEGREPIGARIRFWGVTWTIVGVVANEKFHGVTEADPIAAYAPFAQAPTRGTGVLLVHAARSERAGGGHRPVVREIDPALAVFGVEPLDDTLLRSVGQRRFAMMLLTLFAGLALVLAVIGVHGVLSYGVTERRRELGIRVALGAATPPDHVAGRRRRAAVGADRRRPASPARWSDRALSTLLFGVTATDLATYGRRGGRLSGAPAVACRCPQAAPHASIPSSCCATDAPTARAKRAPQ